MPGFVSVAQKLKTTLDLISSSILPVTFEYLETMPSKFPAGMIVLEGSQGERARDTKYNELTVRFRIICVFAAQESQGAFEKWLGLLDALGDEFRKSTHETLDGDAFSFMIEGYEQFADNQSYAQPVVGLSVRVVAKMLKSIM